MVAEVTSRKVNNNNNNNNNNPIYIAPACRMTSEALCPMSNVSDGQENVAQMFSIGAAKCHC